MRSTTREDQCPYQEDDLRLSINLEEEDADDEKDEEDNRRGVCVLCFVI